MVTSYPHLRRDADRATSEKPKTLGMHVRMIRIVVPNPGVFDEAESDKTYATNIASSRHFAVIELYFLPPLLQCDEELLIDTS